MREKFPAGIYAERRKDKLCFFKANDSRDPDRLCGDAGVFVLERGRDGEKKRGRYCKAITDRGCFIISLLNISFGKNPGADECRGGIATKDPEPLLP